MILNQDQRFARALFYKWLYLLVMSKKSTYEIIIYRPDILPEVTISNFEALDIYAEFDFKSAEIFTKILA
jgi:hypothetical protein